MELDSPITGDGSVATLLRRKVLWLGLFSALLVLALVGSAKYLLTDMSGDGVLRHGLPDVGKVKSQATIDPAKNEPYYLDHSVVNRQDLPTEPNPAPMAIAAYD